MNKEISNIVKDTELKHVAIIMDGNRRWAKERNLPSAIGHKKGVEALKETLRACNDFGVKYLTVYAFSTENWNRKQEEVDFLIGQGDGVPVGLHCFTIYHSGERLVGGEGDHLSVVIPNQVGQFFVATGGVLADDFR